MAVTNNNAFESTSTIGMKMLLKIVINPRLNELVDKRSSKCAIAQESLLERDRVLGPALLSAVS